MSTSDPIDLFKGAKLVQLREYGYPTVGARRATPDKDLAFSVIHITGNSRLPSAEGEAAWRLNDPALQNSATFFVNRDGSVVQCLGDPLHMAPWSNGDINKPDTSNWRIQKLVWDGVNANRRTLVAIENVGYEPGSPLTQAQIRTNARIIAHYHKAAGVPVRRSTVIGHYQINSVTRPNCPARDKDVIDQIVKLAQDELSPEEDPMAIAELQAQIDELEEVAARRWRRIVSLIERKEELVAQVAELEATIAELEPLAETNETLKRTVRNLRARVTAIKTKVAEMAADVSDD